MQSRILLSSGKVEFFTFLVQFSKNCLKSCILFKVLMSMITAQRVQTHQSQYFVVASGPALNSYRSVSVSNIYSNQFRDAPQRAASFSGAAK